MSVQSQIDRINENVTNTYSILEEAGAEMPQSRNTNNLPGTAASISAVLYGKVQNLTEEQKAQARQNIGVSDSGGDSDVLVVTISDDDIASHSPAEIKEASDAGKLVVMRNDGVFVHLGTALTDKATFVHSEIAIAGSSGIAGNIAYTVNADKSVTDNTEMMQLSSPPETETWTFTLEDGSTVTKAVHVG